MPTALLAGAFGQANPGDEALLEAFITALPDWRVVATTSDPHATRDRHGCDVVPRTNRLALGRAVARSDGVVFAGGTIFKRLDRSARRPPLGLLTNAVALAATARAAQKPVAVLGVGAGDLRGPLARSLSRRLVGLSQLVVLRDDESAAELASAGVPPPFRVGADPAWTVVGDSPAQQRENVVVVALSHLAAAEAQAPALARALRDVAARGHQVHLQPWQSDGAQRDLGLALDLAARLGPAARIVEAPQSVGAACDTFARARAVVGLRFHSLVAAAAARTPFVAVAHEPKLAAAARRFGQPVLRADMAASCLPDAVADAMAGPPPSTAVAHGEVAAAEEGFRLLRLVLNRGGGDDSDSMTGLPLVPQEWRP